MRPPPARHAGRGVSAGALLLLSLAFISCGGGTKTPTGTTIAFWQFWDGNVMRPLVEKFEAENPGVHVDMQQLTWQNGKERILAAAAAGNSPDVCELGSTWFAEFAAAGALADITAETDTLRDRLGFWEAGTYDGRIHGVPWVVGTRALFYNKALFRAAGLDDQTAPDSWDRLTAAAKAINDPARGIYGYGRNAGERYILFKKFMPFAWSIEGDVLSPDGKESVFNSSANVEALKYYLSLGDCSLTEKQDILDQAFKQGKIGMLLSGAWLFKTIPTDAPDLDYGVGLVPRPNDHWGTQKSFGGGELLTVSSKSAHKAEAVKLAAFLARADNALALARTVKSVQPAAKGVEDDPYYMDHPGERVFVQQLKLGVFPPNIPRWSEIEAAVEKWVEKAMYGQATPEEAVRAADLEIRAILAGPKPGS